MKSKLAVLACIALALGFVGVATASNIDQHTVTVTLSSINEIDITGGNIELTINAATAGEEPNEVNNSTCGLDWTTTDTTKKITVETNLTGFNLTLKALAQSVTGGTAAAEVTLSDTPQNFVIGVSKTTGGCTIKYTAAATASDGPPHSEVHTVKYTLTAV